MRRLALILAVAIFVLAVPAIASAGPVVKAPVVKLDVPPPTGGCGPEQIGDIEIINGVLFECVCEQRVFTEPTCDWYEVTSQAEDPTRFRKYVRWARYWRHHIVYRYVRVKVVAA